MRTSSRGVIGLLILVSSIAMFLSACGNSGGGETSNGAGGGNISAPASNSAGIPDESSGGGSGWGSEWGSGGSSETNGSISFTVLDDVSECIDYVLFYTQREITPVITVLTGETTVSEFPTGPEDITGHPHCFIGGVDGGSSPFKYNSGPIQVEAGEVYVVTHGFEGTTWNCSTACPLKNESDSFFK